MMIPGSLIKNIRRIADALEQIARELKMLRIIMQGGHGAVIAMEEVDMGDDPIGGGGG